jgi:IMP dehydrogenase
LLLVVDEPYRCVGLITVKDMEKAVANPFDVRFSPSDRIDASLRNGAKGQQRT